MSLATLHRAPDSEQTATETSDSAEAVRDLLAMVLHEVRPLLASLSATVEVLANNFDELGPQETRALLHRIQCSISWLQSLVENLTVEAQRETRQLHLSRGPVDLAACAETALALVQPMLARAGQAVQVVGDAPVAWGDPRRVEQVLVNLLINASKYAGAGTPIRIALGRVEGWTTATVQDRGPGIPLAEQGRLFERYARGEAAEQGGQSGLGLGLHIVKTLVEHQGGRVGLLSAPGQGAAFWFSLPRAPISAPPDRAIRRGTCRRQSPRGRRGPRTSNDSAGGRGHPS